MLQLIFSRVSFWLSLAGVALGVLLLLHFLRAEPVPSPAVAPSPKPPGTRVAASGIVEAFGDNVKVASPVGGVVAKVPVSLGDWVQAGQPLFELDSRMAVANVKSAEAALMVARAQLARVQGLKDRLAQVKDPRAVSEEEVATRGHDVAIAKAQVAAAEAELSHAQVALDQLTVRSPREGAVLQLNLKPGEFAPPGSPVPPVVVGNNRELQVRADIDEELATRLPDHPEAVAYLKGSPHRAIPLELIRIEPLVVPKTSLTGSSTERVDTRVLQVILRIVNDQENFTIYIGQQVDVFLGS